MVAGLAAVTGCLDAVSLARLTGTFVAFQTGNLVLGGLEFGRSNFGASAPPLVAVLAYLAGSALVPAVVRRGRPSGAAAARRLLGAAIGLLVVEVVLVGAGVGLEADAARPAGTLRYLCIGVAAVAMALQTAVVRNVNGVSVSSTFSTGMLARLGQSLASWRDVAAGRNESHVARILGVTIVAFLIGATIGGVMVKAFGNAAVLVPLLGLLVLTVFAPRVPRAA